MRIAPFSQLNGAHGEESFHLDEAGGAVKFPSFAQFCENRDNLEFTLKSLCGKRQKPGRKACSAAAAAPAVTQNAVREQTLAVFG